MTTLWRSVCRDVLSEQHQVKRTVAKEVTQDDHVTENTIQRPSENPYGMPKYQYPAHIYRDVVAIEETKEPPKRAKSISSSSSSSEGPDDGSQFFSNQEFLSKPKTKNYEP